MIFVEGKYKQTNKHLHVIMTKFPFLFPPPTFSETQRLHSGYPLSMVERQQQRENPRPLGERTNNNLREEVNRVNTGVLQVTNAITIMLLLLLL